MRPAPPLSLACLEQTGGHRWRERSPWPEVLLLAGGRPSSTTSSSRLSTNWAGPTWRPRKPFCPSSKSGYARVARAPWVLEDMAAPRPHHRPGVVAHDAALPLPARRASPSCTSSRICKSSGTRGTPAARPCRPPRRRRGSRIPERTCSSTRLRQNTRWGIWNGQHSASPISTCITNLWGPWDRPGKTACSVVRTQAPEALGLQSAQSLPLYSPGHEELNHRHLLLPWPAREPVAGADSWQVTHDSVTALRCAMAHHRAPPAHARDPGRRAGGRLRGGGFDLTRG